MKTFLQELRNRTELGIQKTVLKQTQIIKELCIIHADSGISSFNYYSDNALLEKTKETLRREGILITDYGKRFYMGKRAETATNLNHDKYLYIIGWKLND